MRIRRFIAFAMLSLLLALSQQMGVTHGMSHWTDSRNIGQQQARHLQQQLSKSVAPDQGCAQCMAFAQIGSALGTPFHSLPVVHDTMRAIVIPPAQPDCLGTDCVFQSRAPPVHA